MIRVLIVDDSITQREILREVLEADIAFTVVAEARDGSHAVELVKAHRPDVVLMDVHMPNMDGVEATRQIMNECPTPIVIVSATLRKHDIDHGLAALEAGAISLLQKPQGAALLHLRQIKPELREAILAASQAHVKRRPFGRLSSACLEAAPRRDVSSVQIVGICTSTGGPPVLVEILSSLPAPFPLPILLVQHISEQFVEGFATWLSARTGQVVRIARNEERLEAVVWVAPAGNHLTLGSSQRIRLLPKVTTDIHCPSGNPLFSSLAKNRGAKAAGILLTGMGDDGAWGLLELKQAGGLTLIQDEATCLIYGMPGAAKRLGAGQYELPPKDIAAFLSEIATRKQSASK